MRIISKQLHLALFSLLAGCTSQATTQAIQNYQRTELQKQQAVDNALRIANEQMHLNLQQYVKAHPEQAADAIRSAWKARNTLEEVRVQYVLGRAWTQATVGQYLYDQQGWLSVLIGDKSMDLSKLDKALDAGRAASGVSVGGLLDQGVTARPSTRPSLEDRLRQIKAGEAGVPAK